MEYDGARMPPISFPLPSICLMVIWQNQSCIHSCRLMWKLEKLRSTSIGVGGKILDIQSAMRQMNGLNLDSNQIQDSTRHSDTMTQIRDQTSEKQSEIKKIAAAKRVVGWGTIRTQIILWLFRGLWDQGKLV